MSHSTSGAFVATRQLRFIVCACSLAAGPGCMGAAVPGDEGASGASAAVSPTDNHGTQASSDGTQARNDPAAAAAAAFAPGPLTFRRLTLSQYRNSVQDLLGADIAISSNIADVSKSVPNEYTTLAAARDGFAAEAMDLQDSALAAVGVVFGNDTRRRMLVGCAPAAAGDPCIRSFVSSFGRRAWRRPLSAVEVDRYLGVVTTAAAKLNDLWGGISYAVAGLLQSPNLLYLAEIGEPEPANPRQLRLTGYEMASRISYAIIGSIPDAELLDAADKGQLVTPAGIRTEVRRLLTGGATGRRGVARFFGEYFSLDDLAGLGKDPKLFPMATTALAAAMRGEVEQVLEDGIFMRAADYRNLFTSRSTFVNTDLAKLYGLPAPAAKGFSAVTLPDGGDRVGLLGTAAYLSLNAGVKDSSPTLRGKFVRDRVLCQNVPPPPPNVDTTLKPDPAVAGPQTKRQQLEAHRKDPACAGCHGLMDPVGVTLEHFDAIGRYRATDAGLAIDARGDLDGKAFDGLVGLAQTLGSHPDVPGCLSRQLFRYFSGRLEVPGEEAVMSSLARQFASNGDVKGLIAELAASDMFRLATGN